MISILYMLAKVVLVCGVIRLTVKIITRVFREWNGFGR